MYLHDLLNKPVTPNIQAVRMYANDGTEAGTYQVFIAYFEQGETIGYCSKVNFLCDCVDMVSQECYLSDSEIQMKMFSYYRNNQITSIEMLIDNEWTDSYNGKTFLEILEG